MERKLIEFRQLCMLAKTILQQDPTIDDAEWKARARDTMAKWGFAQPPSEQLGRAMTQVEHALKQTIGPRPTRSVPVQTTPPAAPAPPQFEGRTNRPAGWDIVVRLMAKLATSASSGNSQPRPEIETLSVSEEMALNEFWVATRDERTNRLALLRAFAEVAILRPSGWDVLGVRAQANDHRLSPGPCFACGHGDRPAHWHHIIQIQHGGSNYLRNRVLVCSVCHGELGESSDRRVLGWSQLSECGASAAGELERRQRTAS